MKNLLIVLSVSTASIIGTLFMFNLNLSSDALLACILGCILLVLSCLVLFVTFENDKQDNKNFEEAMRRDERRATARRRKA